MRTFFDKEQGRSDWTGTCPFAPREKGWDRAQRSQGQLDPDVSIPAYIQPWHISVPGVGVVGLGGPTGKRQLGRPSPSFQGPRDPARPKFLTVATTGGYSLQ